ncbi:MAG: LysE family translocator [Hyphomicrobiales bacterium]
MTHESLIALALYAFVTSVTPGPNNLMLLASGVNFGFRQTFPHMLGIAFGFTAMVALVGFGLGAVLTLFPIVFNALRVLALVYMVWLSWKLASSGSLGSGDAKARPMTFIEAALFQWINPKAWAMALTATTLYTVPEMYYLSVVVVAGTFGVINLPSVSCWAGFGVALRGFLSVPARLRIFNVGMAVLLLLSTLPFIRELIP